MLFKCFKLAVNVVAYTIVAIAALGVFAFGFSLGIMLIRNAIMGVIG